MGWMLLECSVGLLSPDVRRLWESKDSTTRTRHVTDEFEEVPLKIQEIYHSFSFLHSTIQGISEV